MQKGINKLQNAGSKVLDRCKDGEGEEACDAPTCPFCLEEVKAGATRCLHCAGAFDEPIK